MPNNSRKTIFATISVDKETTALVEKICKCYSLKKSQVVKLAFGYIDKAHIDPSEAPESVKSELLKISLRTLQTYRDTGVLPYSQIGRKCYYKASDIEQFINQQQTKR